MKGEMKGLFLHEFYVKSEVRFMQYYQSTELCAFHNEH